LSEASRPAVLIEPLADHHDRSGFTCEVEPLDRYFRTQAGQDVRRRVAACFLLVEPPSAVPIGFYTLAATSVALTDLPDGLAKRLPRYPLVPAILMGRLAVDVRRRGQRWGEHLLLDALARALRSDIATFAFVIDAKDDAAMAFYTAYGFRSLTAASRRLFMPMAEAAKLFA
jgi:ribosomal protein S18 acetylase RimI-like enzyme